MNQKEEEVSFEFFFSFSFHFFFFSFFFLFFLSFNTEHERKKMSHHLDEERILMLSASPHGHLEDLADSEEDQEDQEEKGSLSASNPKSRSRHRLIQNEASDSDEPHEGIELLPVSSVDPVNTVENEAAAVETSANVQAEIASSRPRLPWRRHPVTVLVLAGIMCNITAWVCDFPPIFFFPEWCKIELGWIGCVLVFV